MRHALMGWVLGWAALAGAAGSVTNTLEAARDTFGRSNNRNRNSGASEALLVARNPSVRSIVGFDLSSVTNEIVAAEFSIRIKEGAAAPLDLTIAPMARTPGNAAWREGAGALGARGQNARVGESTYQWRAFRDKPWEAAGGRPVANLADARLWGPPVARLDAVDWAAGAWIVVPVRDVAWLEAVRLSGQKVATLGLWGTAGDGTYFLCAKESGHAPKLRLTLKVPGEESR